MGFYFIKRELPAFDANSGDKAEGLYVSGVVKDSPAFKAGLLLGDKIVEVDNQKLKHIGIEEAGASIISTGETVHLSVERFSDIYGKGKLFRYFFIFRVICRKDYNTA